MPTLADLREDRKTRVLLQKQREKDRVPENKWRWESIVVSANSKSEARALIKGIVGSPLPKGMNIVRMK